MVEMAVLQDGKTIAYLSKNNDFAHREVLVESYNGNLRSIAQISGSI